MSEWKPIASAPKDKTPILRPHVMWGPMSVQFIPEGINGFHWTSVGYNPAWPDDAFLPYWQPLPDPPKGGEGDA